MQSITLYLRNLISSKANTIVHDYEHCIISTILCVDEYASYVCILYMYMYEYASYVCIVHIIRESATD